MGILDVPADNVNYGFVKRSGRFSTFTAPGAGSGPGQGTIPVSISIDGMVAGDTIDNGDVTHGWILRGRKFTALDDPLAGGGSFQGTTPLNGNEDGDAVVGIYVDPNNVAHGFVAYISG